MTDIELIERACRGDERAMATLYEQYAPYLYRLAWGLLGNREDAEEVVQDALAYALRRLERYDPQRAAFKTWLHTITVSRCRNKRRRRWLSRVPLAEWFGGGGDLPSPGQGPEGALLAGEEARQVWKALDKLSPKVREVVVLRYWGAHTMPEIAHIVGCKTSTASSRLRLAHEHMQRYLGAQSPCWSAAEEVVR